MDYNFQFSETNSTNFDLIRGIAAQLIALTHAREAFITLKIKNTLGATSLGLLFLISGILISFSTFGRMSKKKFEFKRFFIRRFSRIYPPLVVSLLLVLLIDGYLIFIVYDGEPNIAYSIRSFLLSLFLLNDSAIGITGFGSLRPLWALPLFWWLYMVFGWVVLGKRTTQNRYLYYSFSLIFIVILIIICMGFHRTVKIGYIIIWFAGIIFSYLINILNMYVQKNYNNKNISIDINNHLKRKIKIISLSLSIILFFLAIIRYISYGNQFGLFYYLLLSGSFCFFFVFSQYSSFIYPKKIKKIINFLASYSFTLYLLNYTIFGFYMRFKTSMNNYILFIITYIITNIICILIASFSEMQTSRISRYLLKKLNLER